ncbi:MAG TPA: hypothetical protein VF656_00955 [Pyrinomonadaceae bacterium]|jgi:outer membrane lipoprotein-sorting protein
MMKSYSTEDRVSSTNFRATCASSRLHVWLLLVLAVFVGASGAFAQQGKPRKLPSPDKIVSDYLKIVGGRKRLAAVRDATYEWRVQTGAGGAQQQGQGTARTYVKFPASTRTDIALGNGETNAAANARSAWLKSTDGELRTLTDTDANVAKLLSALDASRLVDYKKQDVLARTTEFSDGGSYLEPAYVVEFSRRNGARLSYWFGVDTKLPVQVADEARRLTIRYKDYRAGQAGLVEPHRIEIDRRDAEPLALTLKSVRYNEGLSDSLFEPPSDSSLNISELLRAVARNQEELDRRVGDYTFTRTETEREIDDKGVVKKEKTRAHEIYPVAGGGRALKLISEDGVPLSPARLAEEEREVVETIKRIERDNAKRKEKEQRERAAKAERARRKGGETGAGADGDEEIGIGVFLRACEFVSPRRENFRGRAAIVFDFRPRPNFKPANRGESIIGKLAGVAWIDPVDRQVMRLEARLSEGFKIGGGLVASVRPGSAFAFEQTRLEDGVWLPRFSQINASAKVFLFAGFRIDATREYSNYRRFSTNVGDAKVEAPPAPSPPDERL